MRRALAGLVLAAALVAAPALPASAAPAPVEYSSDGVTWSPVAPVSIFPGATGLVPGEVRTATWYFRSIRPIASVLSFAVLDATTSDPLFSSALSLSGLDQDGTGMVDTAFGAIADCTAPVPAREVAFGDVVTVTFELSVSPTLTLQQAQNATARFSLVVGLADEGAPMDAAGCPIGTVIAGTPGSSGGGTGGAGAMANTGSTIAAPLVVFGVTSLLCGIVAVLLARRRRAEREETA